MEGLAQELRTRPSHLYGGRFSAPAEYRRDAALGGDADGTVEASAVGSERGGTPRGKLLPSAGEACEDQRVFMGGKRRRDLLVIRANAGVQGVDLGPLAADQ